MQQPALAELGLGGDDVIRAALTGLPFGHVPTKVLLPVGHQVDLLVQDRDALLFWG